MTKMSKSTDAVKKCRVCGLEKPVSSFASYRSKCKTCKSAENCARLKERYRTDPEFAVRAKERASKWWRENSDYANETRRRRYARKRAAVDAAAKKGV